MNAQCIVTAKTNPTHADLTQFQTTNYFKKQKSEKSCVFFAVTLTPKLSGHTHNSDRGRHVGITDDMILKSGTMFVPNFMEIRQLIQRLLIGS